MSFTSYSYFIKSWRRWTFSSKGIASFIKSVLKSYPMTEQARTRGAVALGHNPYSKLYTLAKTFIQTHTKITSKTKPFPKTSSFGTNTNAKCYFFFLRFCFCHLMSFVGFLQFKVGHRKSSSKTVLKIICHTNLLSNMCLIVITWNNTLCAHYLSFLEIKSQHE